MGWGSDAFHPDRGGGAAIAALPIGDLLLGLVAADAVALLDATQQLVALAGDDVEIVVGQLAPLLLDLALELLPVALDGVLVHDVSPAGSDGCSPTEALAGRRASTVARGRCRPGRTPGEGAVGTCRRRP